MAKNFKSDFQDIHYLRKKPSFFLKCALSVAEFGYKAIINTKNFLYSIGFSKEAKMGVQVICVGNLTTGGVGKTPIVIELANELSSSRKVAIVSRGYGAKISNKKPNIIKDNKGLKFADGRECGDEPFQIAKKVKQDVVVITCSNRKKAIELAIVKYGINTVVLDDGFSNRKVKKDKIILAIDSKMRFGNERLLPYGPLREPISEIKRADEIILVDKADEKLNDAIIWAKNFNKPLSICRMQPKRIYNLQSGADIKLNNERAIAFCAIGQSEQFFDFARQFYEIIPVKFDDHYKYSKSDIQDLIKIARENNITTFITTQKDETKLKELIKNISNYSFNVLELKVEIQMID
ncbi:MAG: tetraacyldisaccharide 4'-kinase [Candidatus Gastranaerophilales bacterium]|nr:tetraacyldisaccharide 4'-kinase [Candidatus Gastranaerophilales bacterium]